MTTQDYATHSITLFKRTYGKTTRILREIYPTPTEMHWIILTIVSGDPTSSSVSDKFHDYSSAQTAYHLPIYNH